MLGSFIFLLAVTGAEARPEASGPRVVGNTSCPRPEEVERRLLPLLPARQPATAEVSATVTLSDLPADAGARGAVEMTLRRAGEQAVVARIVERTGSCADLANVLSVVAASWLSPWAVRDPVSPRPWTAPAAFPPSPPHPAPPALSAPPAGRDASVVVRAAAGLVTGAEGGSAPFGVVAVDRSVGRNDWFGRVALDLQGTRRVSLASGAVDWRRTFGVIGLGRARRAPAWGLEAQAGAAVGAVALEGRGFDVNQRATRLDVGIAVGVGGWWRLAASPVALSVGVQAAGWARPHRVWVAEIEDFSRRLPWLEVQLGFGLAWVALP